MNFEKEGRSRVIGLRQCAIVCDSPPLSREMEEAADFIEKLLKFAYEVDSSD